MSRSVEAPWPLLLVEVVVAATPEPRAPWGGVATMVRWGFGVRGPCLDVAPSPVRGLACGLSLRPLAVPEPVTLSTPEGNEHSRAF